MSDWIKANARVVHFASMGLLCSYVTGLLLIDHKSGIPKWHRMLGHIGGIGTVLSGLTNWWFLKSYKPRADVTSFRIWTSIVHCKLLLVLVFFTPIASIFGGDKVQNTLRIILMGLFVAVSPFARRLRESFNPKYDSTNLTSSGPQESSNNQQPYVTPL